MGPSRLPAWRVAVAHVRDGVITHLESAFTMEVQPFHPTKPLRDPRGFHVGTTRNFCLDYYTGMIAPEEGRKEVLFELEVQPRHLQKADMAERWEWPCGTEAVVTEATIKSFQIL